MSKGSPQPTLFFFFFGDNLQYIYQIRTDEQSPLQAESMTPERLSLLQHKGSLLRRVNFAATCAAELHSLLSLDPT